MTIPVVYPTLALDVSTSMAHACLITSCSQVYHAQSEVGKQHSQTVLPLLENLLQQANITWSDLKLLVLGQGPGSFTGLRIAAATIAGINASLKLPVWNLSSLAITSMQIESEETLWVIEDARAHEVFLGCYQGGAAQQKDACIHNSALPSNNTSMPYVCSTDFQVNQTDWHRMPLTHSRSHALAHLIQRHMENIDIQNLTTSVQPIYLQLSQAERNLQHG